MRKLFKIVEFLFQFHVTVLILSPDLQKPNPMNLLRKLTELSPMRFISRQIRIDISRKDLIDFSLLVLICFMIVVYKVNKQS